jgi:hypothetical protein
VSFLLPRDRKGTSKGSLPYATSFIEKGKGSSLYLAPSGQLASYQSGWNYYGIEQNAVLLYVTCYHRGLYWGGAVVIVIIK